MNSRRRTQLLLEFIVDLVCIIFANIASFVIFNNLVERIPSFSRIEWIRYDGLLIVSFAVIFLGFHKPVMVTQRNKSLEVLSLLQNATLTFSLFAVLIIMFKSPIVESRYMLLSNYAFFIAFSGLGRYFLKRYLSGYFKNSRIASMVGIITTSDIAEDFVSEIKKDWSKNITGIVLLDDYCINNKFSYSADSSMTFFGSASVSLRERTPLPKSIDDIPVISTDDRFINWFRSAPLDEVYINLPYGDDSEVQELIEELEEMGITVHINIPMLDDIIGESKFNNISCRMQYGLPMASFAAVAPQSGRLIVKRIFDVVAGSIGCLVSLPVIAITAIPLLRESPGPLIFKQQRVGKNGRLFNIYKLRSMYVDAEERKKELMEQNKMEGFMFKVDDDPRITKVGKFIRRTSIDELPQFFNVVKGDMSLVGTRPPTVDEFEKYESRHKRRLSMRPGITGMWQVSGRSDIQDFEEVVKLDCQYIDEWSILLDIKILFKTVGVVLTHKGAE